MTAPPAPSDSQSRDPLGKSLRLRLRAAVDAARAADVAIDLEVTPRGHGALVSVLIDGKPAFGPVAPELAEAFVRGVAVGADAIRAAR